MKKRQKICLWLGIIIFVLIGLFPPNTIRDGWPWFIFELRGHTICYSKLMVQWILVVVITSSLIYALRDKQKVKEKEGTEK